jgi:hypothetical protein
MSFNPVANTWLLDRDLKIRSKAIPWDVSRQLPTWLGSTSSVRPMTDR